MKGVMASIDQKHDVLAALAAHASPQLGDGLASGVWTISGAGLTLEVRNAPGFALLCETVQWGTLASGDVDQILSDIEREMADTLDRASPDPGAPDLGAPDLGSLEALKPGDRVFWRRNGEIVESVVAVRVDGRVFLHRYFANHKAEPLLFGDIQAVKPCSDAERVLAVACYRRHRGDDPIRLAVLNWDAERVARREAQT